MIFLLDTVILIDLMRFNSVAIVAVSNFPEKPCYCDVSVMELYTGARSQREESEIDQLLRQFQRVPIGPEIYRRAGSLLKHFRASHGTGTGDALIAATAEHHGLALATLNVKHFPMFKRLRAPY
jgi:predicted nucleic acid-binding protein